MTEALIDASKIDEGTDIPYSQEVLRKSIHLLSLTIPVWYYFIDKTTALWLLAPLVLLFVSVDVLSSYFPVVKSAVSSVFGRLLRSHEREHEGLVLNGASWVLISAWFCMRVLTKEVFLCAFTILIISDTAAALVGRKWGRHKFLGKSIEGSLAFLVTAVIVILIVVELFNKPDEFLWWGLVAAFAGMVMEAIAKELNVDDNFAIPLVIASILQ